MEIKEQTPADLVEYARIPIAFEVMSRYRVEALQNGLAGLALIEEPVTPYRKDYDAIPNEGPLHWAAQWDLSRWGLFAAFEDGERIGGAAISRQSEVLSALEGHADWAALWDLRVRPDYRGQGVGHRLFAAALAWARTAGCRRLLIETQNINVPACRFYTRQGCILSAVDPYAYGPSLDEVRLLWSYDLGPENTLAPPSRMLGE